MGLLLFIAANIIAILVFPLAIVVTLVQSFYNHHFKSGIKTVDGKFKHLAISFDKYGNVFCAELFNATLISKKAQVKFGNINQTISAVIGWNLVGGTLTGAGKTLNFLLNLFEKDHALKTIQKTEL